MLRKIILLILIITCTSCKLSRFVYYNFADVTDHEIFPNRIIENAPANTFKFKENAQKDLVVTMKNTNSFEEYLTKSETVAFLVIHNDTLKYEQYFNDYDQASIVASFSMAKSVTSILIGCAIEDNFITNVNDPVTKYVPELTANGFDKVTIEHLLQMTSGLDFNESYINPFGPAASFYYGRTLMKSTLNLKLKNEPGTVQSYASGTTQLLGLVLTRALRGKTVSQYLQEKLWKPLGMEYEASWSIDKKKDGIEKTFCCLNARARDFAKIGRLYLNNGNWEGKQIVPKEWVVQSTKIDTLNGSTANYQYQWWLPNKEGDFMAKGILGQYIFVSPSTNLVIVRLGKDYGDVNWVSTFEAIKNIVK